MMLPSFSAPQHVPGNDEVMFDDNDALFEFDTVGSSAVQPASVPQPASTQPPAAEEDDSISLDSEELSF